MPGRKPLRNTVVILASDPQDADCLARLIEAASYRTHIHKELDELRDHAADTWLAIILDIDSVPLDNRTIRNLTLTYPGVAIFCTSRERFHPELKEAICYHLFACLNKPIDADELYYLLKCVGEDPTPPHPPPDG